MSDKTKLLICDIDGTLALKGEMIMPETRDALLQYHEQGTLLGLSTGRPVERRTIGKFKEWGMDFEPDFVVGFNGCEIWDKKSRRTRRYDLLKKEDVREILDYMWPLDVNVVVFEEGYDRVLVRRMDEMLKSSILRNDSTVVFTDKETFCSHDVCKLEFHYDEAIEEEILNVIQSHRSDRYSHSKTFTGTIEFQDPNVNKGRALHILCKQNNINLDEVIACGDMDNDIPMMELAGTGICLSNGSAAARKAADYVTEYDVTEDGLGRYLQKYFLPKGDL